MIPPPIAGLAMLDARTAYVALHSLSAGSGAINIAEEHIAEGLRTFGRRTDYTGRWKLLGDSPVTIADSAHNESGLLRVTDAIKGFGGDMTRLVLGFASDKDLAAVLPLFPPDAVFYFCKPNVPRGMDTDIIATAAGELGLNFSEYGSVTEALEAAQADASEDDLIFVGGSSFVVAEVV